MYIRNGIAYTGEPVAPIRVLQAMACENYKLHIEFSTGEFKIFSFLPYLEMPCFQKLKDPSVFNNVQVEYGCPTWDDGNIDIAPETLYEQGVLTEE